MPSSVAGLFAAEATRTLPMPSYVFGLLALAGFALLLGLTWAFRGAHNKYGPPARHTDDGDSDH